jgi:hypothetical protein
MRCRLSQDATLTAALSLSEQDVCDESGCAPALNSTCGFAVARSADGSSSSLAEARRATSDACVSTPDKQRFVQV